MKNYTEYLKNNRKIYPIKEDYIFPNIQYGNKKVAESLLFHPGEVWYDDNGLIRLFSINYEGGLIGNYFLYPKNSPMAFVYETLNTDLISFGLKLIGDSILQGSSVIHSVSKYLYKKASDNTERTISDFLEDMNSANLGYVELSSKEIVFNNSLSLEMGFPTRLLEIVIQNPNNIDLNYETSRNGKEWKTYKLESNKFDKFYFMNGQKHGFFRIKTENSDFQTYEIKSENQYMINWNEQKGVWDLFLA